MFDLERQFGEIDIYLFDQLLKGRIQKGMRVLDAGCGSGRNLVYLLQAGVEVYATDIDAGAVNRVRKLALALSPSLVETNFRLEPVERMTFEDGFADVVISSAVLHFARNHDQFSAMVSEMWRVLNKGGLLFARLASSIGMETRVRPLSDGRFLLPDGSERYLVDEDRLLTLTDGLGGRLLDPIKTTIVQNQRCMTTWVVRKT
jgi:ubiquinone/menaquinone biosynthesis C-methylase UbiE